MDVRIISGSAGSPTVATMAVPPAVVPPVADPSAYIVTWAFVSQIDCKLMLDNPSIPQLLDKRKGCTILIWVPGQKENQATRPLTNSRKQLPPPPPIRRPDASHLPLRKPSSDAPSPIPRPTGPKPPWYTNISPRSQTASPPPTGQMLFSKPAYTRRCSRCRPTC